MPFDPVWDDSLSYTGQELRRADLMMVMANGSALGARSGIRPGAPGLTTTLSGSTINVSAGAAAIYQSGQGVYRAAMTSAWTGTLSAADATYTRIDLVYLRVWDTDVDASGLRQADVVYLPGTASATPVAPTPAGTQIYIQLATITVPPSGGGAASVSTAVRPYTVAPGGILPSSTAPSSPYVGQFYDDGSDLRRYNGTDWDVYQKVQTVGWTTPALRSGFTGNGNSNGTVQYRAVTIAGGNFMQWRGGLNLTYSGSSIAGGGDFLNVALLWPFRPLSLRSVPVACSAVSSTGLSLKVDFLADGTTQIVGTGTGNTPPWLSLNNVQYSID